LPQLACIGASEVTLPPSGCSGDNIDNKLRCKML